MKRRTAKFAGFAILVAVSALSIGVNAETLLWYRFDGDGATIVNRANPGTMDGTLKSMNTWGSVNALVSDTDTSKFPTRGDAFPEGTRLIDPATDVISTGTTLSIGTGGKSIKGMIDELRFRPGVQPVSSFMRRLPGGLTLILR